MRISRGRVNAYRSVATSRKTDTVSHVKARVSREILLVRSVSDSTRHTSSRMNFVVAEIR